MRRMIVMAVCFGVVACEQNKAAEAANTPGWTQTNGAGEVVLLNQAAGDAPAFAVACTKAGAALTFTASIAQVGIANIASPYSLVLSGATFPARAVRGAAEATTFSVTAPLSPEVLAALRDTTTARIFVNDSFAFAESDVDPGQVFEKFAADCAALTGVAARP
ncbi:MAG: hypothetical protein K8S25_16740 [Alphaproteobacteria bacterium]|nr:hypothetical protein [Alphaproteobacteria bacterium]